MADSEVQRHRASWPATSELHRDHPLEALSWEGSGIGMSVPRTEELADALDLQGLGIRTLKVEGVDVSGQFVPLRSVILSEDGRAVEMDRGMHPAMMHLVEPRSGLRERINGIPFVTLDVRQGESPLGSFPPSFSGRASLATKTLDVFTSHKIKGLRMRGNNTLAVGLLANSVTLETERGLLFEARVGAMEAREIERLFGLVAARQVPRLFYLAPRWGASVTGNSSVPPIETRPQVDGISWSRGWRL